MLLLASWWSVARADEVAVLPKGHADVAAGLELGTWANYRYGAGSTSGLVSDDRLMRTTLRVDGLWGWGGGLQVGLHLPVSGTSALTADGTCADVLACAPTTGVGPLEGDVRVQMMGEPGSTKLDASAELGLRSDAWNAEGRGAYTRPGDGTTDVLATILVGRRVGGRSSWGWLGSVGYVLRGKRDIAIGPDAPWRAPADEVDLRVEARSAVADDVVVHAGVLGVDRLWGVADEADFVTLYGGTADRWTVLFSADVRTALGVDLALSEGTTVGLLVDRTVWARNAPIDRWDVAASWTFAFGG